MLERTLKSLEYDKILSELSKCAVSSTAKEQIKSLKPTSVLSEAELLLNQTEEADKTLYVYSISPEFSVDDISTALERAKILSTLTLGDILKVGRVLKCARDIKSALTRVPELNFLPDFYNRIFTNKPLEDEISSAILSDTEINDNASSMLRDIRNKIRRLNENIKTKLNQYITSPSYAKYLQDNLVTVRGDRYVIPVKSEFRGQISGLVHDQSASGQTVYIEPMQVVELNNELKNCIIDEQREIEKILRDFTYKISADVDGIEANFSIITALDCIFAKAKYAHSAKAVKPELNSKGYINIVEGKHPLINSEKVVPTSIYLGDAFDILLVTGPNTGGKTVTLKLTGLFTLMALSGLYLPAKAANISVFDNVFCDIGDEQSIEQSLSTFSGHISNIIHIIDDFSANSLLLLDELGAGTDPSEGAVLAVAITKYIKKLGAKAVITSHYNELKEYSIGAERVENASMDFDVKTFSPTYHLTIGVAGASNALYIAKRLGLKCEILDDASAMLSQENKDFNKILLSAERARQKAEKLTETARENKIQTAEELKKVKEEREKLRNQADKINENLRKETKKLINSSVDEADEIIEQMKELLKDLELDESALFEARKLKKRLEKISAEYVDTTEIDQTEIDEIVDNSPIKAGDVIIYKPFNTKAEVIKISKDELTIKIGSVNSNVKITDCVKVNSPKPKEEKTKPKSIGEVRNNLFKTEINVIGQDTSEALYNVDKFLDDAVMYGAGELRIVHGKGTGTLRRAIQSLLKSHYAVKEFRDGIYGEGEKGVTIVKLK